MENPQVALSLDNWETKVVPYLLIFVSSFKSFLRGSFGSDVLELFM